MINLLSLYPNTKPIILHFEIKAEVDEFLEGRAVLPHKSEEVPIYIIEQKVPNSSVLTIGKKVYPIEEKREVSK